MKDKKSAGYSSTRGRRSYGGSCNDNLDFYDDARRPKKTRGTTARKTRGASSYPTRKSC